MLGARFTTFLVKLASRCNLDCDYCYVYRHADQNWRSMPKVLSGSDWAAFSDRLAEYAGAVDLERCVVVFHGGEPLLAGIETIVSFARTIRAVVGATTIVDIAFQTNGILLDDAAVEALQGADIGVSLSLDGPRVANDLHRVAANGQSSFDETHQALVLLKAHPAIFSGVIAVIDPSVEPESLFEFFNTQLPPKLDFLLPDAHHLRAPVGRASDPNRYRDWLIGAFDLWFDKYPHLRIRTFEALLDAVVGLPSGTDAFGLGDVSLLTIETDGTYHDLDVLKIVGDGATRLTGSVRDTPIGEVTTSPAVDAHRRLLRIEGLSEQCRACSIVQICGGGSLPHRFGPQGFDHPTVYCHEMFSLVHHVRTRLHNSLDDRTSKPGPAQAEQVDCAAFDLAESAEELVGRLWAHVRSEHGAQFEEALRLVDLDPPQVTSIAAVVRGSGPEYLADLGNRPGTVAWQRTFRTQAAGRTLHAVDGTPLHADPDYLAAVFAPDDTPIGIRVCEDDPWIRAPFGGAIHFESSEIVAKARPVLDQAMRIIGTWRPAVLAEILRICGAIQFIRDPTAHPDKIVSFSDNAVPGALFVSVSQSEGLIDPYDLADSVIHEYRHQKLFLLERVASLVEPTGMKVVSPWRDELRPPSGLLHAVFVFVELRRFWAYVRDDGPVRLRSRAVAQLAETDERLGLAFETLARCPLTETGRSLVAVLRNAHARSIEPRAHEIATD